MAERRDIHQRESQTASHSIESTKKSFSDEEWRDRIAQAAYYNAQQRGFEGDHALEDWLEAERQLAATIRDQRARQESHDFPKPHSDAAADEPATIDPEKLAVWAKKLGVAVSILRAAMSRVGNRVEDIKRLLNGRHEGNT